MQTAAYGTIILAHWNGQTLYPPVARVSSENVLAPAIGSHAALLAAKDMDADRFQLQAPGSPIPWERVCISPKCCYDSDNSPFSGGLSFMADLAAFLDKAFEDKSFDELADAPVDALAGISKSDADALKQALGIKTIRQLAEHKVILVAQAIVGLAGKK